MAYHGISEAIQNLSLTETEAESLGALGARPKVREEPGETKQSRKKNRKDRRRAGLEDSDQSKPPPMSRVEKLRAERQGFSVVTESPVVSSVSLNTEIKNLPDSFFNDNLVVVEDIETEGDLVKERRDLKKRRRRRQKRKQSSTEEEDKLSPENIEEDNLNDKLIDDDPGEQIVTNFGDQQCVVSELAISQNSPSHQSFFIFIKHIFLVSTYIALVTL